MSFKIMVTTGTSRFRVRKKCGEDWMSGLRVSRATMMVGASEAMEEGRPVRISQHPHPMPSLLDGKGRLLYILALADSPLPFGTGFTHGSRMPSLVPTSEDSRIYEFCILYPYPLNQKEEQTALKEIEELFTEAGGKQVSKDVWGRRGLAYTIKGAKEGNFVVYYYEMDPSKVKEVDQALKIMKGVLRHIVVKPPKHYQIVKYSETYEKWLKDRETADEERSRKKEEAVQEQIARKAKRQAKMTTERKKVAPAPRVGGGEDITQKIDELISGDSIDNI